MAIERLTISFTGQVYKYRVDSYERDGKVNESYKLMLDQNDHMFTFNIPKTLYMSVAPATHVTVFAEYVTGGKEGAYMSVTNIVPFEGDYTSPRDKAIEDLEKEMTASEDTVASTEPAAEKPVKGTKKSQ